MANNGITILPPAHFYGDSAVDTLTSTTFYREVLARMRKDATVNNDKKKINFIVEHLRSDAYDWYENVSRTASGDPLNIFADFQKAFCSRFDVESLATDQRLNTRDVDRMRTTEPLDGYFDRIATYFNSRVPVRSHIPEERITEARTKFREKHADADAATRTLWRTEMEEVAQAAIIKYTDTIIRNIWMNGMHAQFKTVALAMDDPDKETKNIISAMKRRFPSSRLSNAKNVAPTVSNENKVAAVEEAVEEVEGEDQQDDGVAAMKATGTRPKTFNKKGKKNGFKCNHCGLKGHKEADCRKKQAGLPKVNATSDNRTGQNSMDPALEAYIRQLMLKEKMAGSAIAMGNDSVPNF